MEALKAKVVDQPADVEIYAGRPDLEVSAEGLSARMDTIDDLRWLPLLP